MTDDTLTVANIRWQRDDLREQLREALVKAERLRQEDGRLYRVKIHSLTTALQSATTYCPACGWPWADDPSCSCYGSEIAAAFVRALAEMEESDGK